MKIMEQHYDSKERDTELDYFSLLMSLLHLKEYVDKKNLQKSMTVYKKNCIDR